MSDDGTDPGWGAGSSAYARLRRLNDDEDAGSGGFFGRPDDRFDDQPPAGSPVPPSTSASDPRSGSRRRRGADRTEPQRRETEASRREPEPESRRYEPDPGRPYEPDPDWRGSEPQAHRYDPDAAWRDPDAQAQREPTRLELGRQELARQELTRDEAPQPDPADVPQDETRAGRRRRSAGRNVPVSIAVGLLLAGSVLGVLFYAKAWFLAVLVAAACVGIWELVRAIRTSGANPPLVPLMVGGTVMLALVWFRGIEALSLGLLVTVLAVFVWRLADGPAGYQRDMGAAALITVYVPFLLGFAAPLATPDDGEWRILTTLAVVVLSDTGGFVAGVLFGKHPMAPTISPKKSWEGFAGSIVAAAIGASILMWQLFDVAVWWGALFGAVVAVACVLGDLAESLLKRDLGIKDMSNLLPGHGGLMDRLDSIVFALPTAYLLFQLLAPPS